MDYKYADAEIIVFAREPVPGKVKTRLFPAIGEARALSLHCAMIRRVTQMVLDSKLAPLRLTVSSNPDHEVFISCCRKNNITLQATGDLGEKMAQEVETSLVSTGKKFVLLIGADCPSIDACYLESALEKLTAGSEVVLGPAQDGGYVLAGLSRVIPQLFDNLPWGTDKVLKLSVERLRQNKISLALLETRWDVDRPDDLALLAGLQPAIEY